MKKQVLVFFIFAIFLNANISASEYSDLLDKANKEYSKGNFEDAKKALKSAEKILETEISKQNVDNTNVIFVGDLIKEYNTNELKAAKQYYGKEVLIEGYVYSIEKHFDPREKNTPDGQWHEVPSIELAAEPYIFTNYKIDIYFNENDIDEISQLDIGQKILIKGTVYKNFHFIVKIVDADLIKVY